MIPEVDTHTLYLHTTTRMTEVALNAGAGDALPAWMQNYDSRPPVQEVKRKEKGSHASVTTMVCDHRPCNNRSCYFDYHAKLQSVLRSSTTLTTSTPAG
jgi:hypothetical protein